MARIHGQRGRLYVNMDQGVRVEGGIIAAASFHPVDESHPVEWLRGRYEIAVYFRPEDIAAARVRLGDGVTVVFHQTDATGAPS